MPLARRKVNSISHLMNSDVNFSDAHDKAALNQTPS